MKRNDVLIANELSDLEAGRLDPKQFPHREHLRLGYEMLGRYPFPEALARFSAGLRQLAAKGGRPDAYHETITAAFLALIGERRLLSNCASWEEFGARNDDLMNKDLLREWSDLHPSQAESLWSAGGVTWKRNTWLKPGRALEIYALVFSIFISWASLRTALSISQHSSASHLARTD